MTSTLFATGIQTYVIDGPNGPKDPRKHLAFSNNNLTTEELKRLKQFATNNGESCGCDLLFVCDSLEYLVLDGIRRLTNIKSATVLKGVYTLELHVPELWDKTLSVIEGIVDTLRDMTNDVVC